MREKDKTTTRTTDLHALSNIGDYVSFHSQICTEINRHDEKLYFCTFANQVSPRPRGSNSLNQHTTSILLILLRDYFGDEEWTKE
jgi:hypothetical protein